MFIDERMQKYCLEIVNKICTMESKGCRSLNKSEYARVLMAFANIPVDAIIHEIPLDWDNQVEIMFTIPEDKVHKVNYYFALFVGIGCDGKFHFELYKCGEWSGKNSEFAFYVRDKVIPSNYFC